MFLDSHKLQPGREHPVFKATLLAAAVTACLSGSQVLAYSSEDGTTQVNGFVENATYSRQNVGLSKMRNTVLIEGSKDYGEQGAFSNISFVGAFRATYDGVYDLNDDEFGDNAGGSINMQSVGGAGSTAWGQSDVSTGVLGFGFDTTENPNEGMVNLGHTLHDTDGGVGLGVPVRPCDVDSRGCIDDYLDFSESDLKYPEFNDRLDFLREAYIDATLPTDSAATWNFRLGRQQVVWGRTDLFRVLDVINPVDYSRHNIYDELEDIRIPMWMATGEYRMGATETFDDLNMQFLWNFDKFRPNSLGQGGTPYAILDAGSFFRAMKNCWDNGCSVSNFAGGALSTDFPKHVIGIRDVHLPDWSLSNSQVGVKLEGDYSGVGFSLNALTYRSQMPSLRAVVDNADNPFTPEIESQSYDYLIAFDMYFPRVNLVGGSLDFYVDDIKSVFRVEAAYTQGEEFANTLRPELYSESDMFRYVLGWDRPTFIPFLNEKRAFLLSAQLFGEYMVDHEREKVNGIEAGNPNWEINHVGTLLV
ncbi:MAG: DUF1302 family protein, partial [Candidatus Thiodiazotropha sp. 6PDIVS]